MEPESTQTSPTSQPVQPGTEVPQSPAPAPTPAPEMAAPVPAPVETPQTEAPVTPVAPPVTPTPPTPPTQAAVPPVPPTPGTVTPTTSASGSHKGLLITILVLALLAGGAAAGYYYWMNAKAATTQAATAATSTPTANIPPAQTNMGINLRPVLENTINAKDAALAAGSYDDLLKVMGTPEHGKLPTQQEFTDNLNLLRDVLTTDLKTTTFLKTDQQGNMAGYYFTYTASSTTKVNGKSQTDMLTMLGFVKFANDNGTWKIVKLFSKNIDDPSKADQEIATDPELSLTASATSTPQTDVTPTGR